MGDIRDPRGNLMPVPGNGTRKRVRYDVGDNLVANNLYWYPVETSTAAVSTRNLLTGFETVVGAGGANALSLTLPISIIDATSGTAACTLANGTYVGQTKKIICIDSTAGAPTITPAAPGFVGATAAIALTVGEAVTLTWLGSSAKLGWAITGTSTGEVAGPTADLVPLYS
jgi:hypothetical protein